MNLNELFAAAANTMLTPAQTKPQTFDEVGLSAEKVLKTLFGIELINKNQNNESKNLSIEYFNSLKEEYIRNVSLDKKIAFLPKNYCRNYTGEDQQPWCYTSDPTVRWAYCQTSDKKKKVYRKSKKPYTCFNRFRKIYFTYKKCF